MNEVGVSIWKMLAEDVTLEDIVQGILAEYDVDEDIAREDVQDFIDTLYEKGILEQDE